jgi:hypothetical protein
MKKVTLTEEDFKLIVEFVSAITVPFSQTGKASQVLDAINRAELMEIDIKKEIKK